MQRARIINEVAVDVFAPGLAPPHWETELVDVPDEVRPQWVRLPLIEAGAIVAGATWKPPGSLVVEDPPGTFAYGAITRAPAPAAAASRHITKLAFRNRFTQAEKVAIELAGLDQPNGSPAARQQSAALRASMADVHAALYIDLDRADTRAGVQGLEAAGVIGSGRALGILDSPVQPHEIYVD